MRRYEMDATMEVSETGGFVEYSDVEEMERRYREAVEIIRDFDAYTRGKIFRADCERMATFLAEEES